ncbi:TIGR04086 family membrane protein [Paenibacillus yanchengensis]|uniref:TIGR04086 family membrane protein n=1 Tax=Paenibacillus yanchengensis TaxID=2035833 RepID=A0ABW4YL40_9BACL
MNSNSKASQLASPLLAGIVYALLWLAAGALILSLLLHLTAMKESNMSLYTQVIHGIAAFFGGAAAGKRSISKGWYNGGITGVTYFLLVVIVSFLAANISFTLQSVILLATIVLCAAVGGMIGVNLKRS